MAPSQSTLNDIQPNQMSGIIHGAPNPIGGATVTLYTTGSSYGAGATVVATTTTGSDGSFTLTLPTGSAACPAGAYAYIGAYQGTTSGQSNANPNSLLMSVVGPCTGNYTYLAPTNTYTGGNIWIDEMTTAVSAYALSGFMSVSNAGFINIGAPANNTATASTTTPSAAGMAHAFANVANIINLATGQPYAYTKNATSATTGGIIPDNELFLIGNILQACVNSTGTAGSNTATSNDNTKCGKLFSLVTPPQSGAAVPTNTLQAILDLAHYPNPLATWNSGCTATSTATGNVTATSCLFNLASGTGQPYANALGSAPPDWTLAIVYSGGTSGTGSGFGTAGSNPGFIYPIYLALDYQDNVFVENWNANPSTSSNLIGIQYDGTSIFSTTPTTSSNTAIAMIATDTAGHVVGANGGSANGENVPVYNATTGAVVAANTALYNNVTPKAIAIDPSNNVYLASTTAGVNIRKLTYTGPTTAPTYTIANVTAFATSTEFAINQIGFDSSLDFFAITGIDTTPYVYFFTNAAFTNSTTQPPTTILTLSGSTSNASGIAIGSGDTAYAIDSAGATAIAASTGVAVAGTTTALPAVTNSTLYSRYAVADGNNWVYSPDGANGSAVTGVSVYDATDGLALGTYKGCYVNSSNACGTTASTSPMYSPRSVGLDSAGDIWVSSGSTSGLAELIGAAAPSWPGLSMLKFGKPQ